jgi:hypothetical protein
MIDDDEYVHFSYKLLCTPEKSIRGIKIFAYVDLDSINFNDVEIEVMDLIQRQFNTYTDWSIVEHLTTKGYDDSYDRIYIKYYLTPISTEARLLCELLR